MAPTQLTSFSLLQRIEGINNLWREIASIRVTVPLSMFCLCAGKLNEDLCDRAEKLRNKIIVFKMEENRQLNRGRVSGRGETSSSLALGLETKTPLFVFQDLQAV